MGTKSAKCEEKEPNMEKICTKNEQKNTVRNQQKKYEFPIDAKTSRKIRHQNAKKLVF